MTLRRTAFDFSYDAKDIRFGRGCVEYLGTELDEQGRNRALLVCGTNVGSNRTVMDAIEATLEERLIDSFDETTSRKRIGTVLDGVDRIEATDADVLVALGGGSSINVASAMSSIAATDLSRDESLDHTRTHGTVPSPNESEEPIPVIAIPTTMAGADISPGGNVNLTSGSRFPANDELEQISAGARDPRVMPTTTYYDSRLFETTPNDVLLSSAMNGFDKGIETLYSRSTNPISNAHAFYGTRYFVAGLPALFSSGYDEEALEYTLIGTILVQYGRYSNIIHTFGNVISTHYDVQQGAVHGIMAPHVLRYVFDRVDGQRHLIADALDIDQSGKSDADIADSITGTVSSIRDALRLPEHLSTIDGLEREDLPTVARAIPDYYKQKWNPAGINPSSEDVLELLEAAW